VPTLDHLAYNIVAHADKNALFVPIMDALRTQVYTNIYKIKSQKIVKLRADSCVLIDDLLADLARYDKKIIFLGDGLNNPQISDRIKESPLNCGFASPEKRLQDVRSLICAAQENTKKAVNYKYFDVEYLVKPQAERELKCK